MNGYRLILGTDAAKFFERAPAPLQRKLDRCFEQLRTDPHRHNNIKQLKGEFAGLRRYRVGDWRVVYRVDEKERVIVVLLIAHRREVYE